MEKPVAMTVKEGEEILKICSKERVLISVGFMMRFHAYHQKMKEIFNIGKLGEVVSCRGQLTCWYRDIPGNWK